jgi:hypothetical protein
MPQEWTASQAIACLLQRLGCEPVTISIEEMRAWRTSLPTMMTLSDDGKSVTFAIAPPIAEDGSDD